jgi:hypothetical protein
MGNGLAGWQDPVALALADLISRGYVDVTQEADRCLPYEDAYVFRGPDGVLYHCWTRGYVMNVLAESRNVAVMMSRGLTDTHFGRSPDGGYWCQVRWDVVEVV